MSQDISILIVDDEPDLCLPLETYLKDAGYHASSVHDAAGMRERFLSDPPRLVLLDLGLPDGDGIDLARELANSSETGVIIITGRTSQVDRVVGLEIGADDYVMKPFDERELLARVRSVLRRTGRQKPPGLLTAADIVSAKFGTWALDFIAHTLTDQDGNAVHLTGHEFRLLSLFVTKFNRVMSREQLLKHMNGKDWSSFDRSVDIMVGKLRRKIERDPRQPELIKSIHGMGYKFTAEAELVQQTH